MTISTPRPEEVGAAFRIYIPEEEIDAPVVICSELCSNEGASVTYAAEQLAAEVIRYNHLRTPLIWIEHYPPETTNNRTEIFNLVSFSSYEVTEPSRIRYRPHRQIQTRSRCSHGAGGESGR
jgi:hypothetical protein